MRFYVPASSVAELETYLQNPDIQAALPPGKEVRWAADTLLATGGKAVRGLYVLDSRPIITGEYLTDAKPNQVPIEGTVVVDDGQILDALRHGQLVLFEQTHEIREEIIIVHRVGPQLIGTVRIGQAKQVFRVLHEVRVVLLDHLGGDDFEQPPVVIDRTTQRRLGRLRRSRVTLTNGGFEFLGHARTLGNSTREADGKSF